MSLSSHKYKKGDNTMAANGISTHLPKSDRKTLKLQLAQAKRQMVGTNGYRELNKLTGAVLPTIGRPWSK
jgi:hypothetical protein